MCRLGSKLLFEVSIQMGSPIRQPDLERWEWDEFLEVEEEGRQGVFTKGNSNLPCPDPSLGIQRPDRLMGKDRDQGLGLTTPVRPVTRLQLGILRHQTIGCGTSRVVTRSTL